MVDGRPPSAPASPASVEPPPDGPTVRLPAAALAAAARPAQPVGERKQVTVLFSDVEGSMELAERLDPERWQEIMARVFAIFCEVVERYEGTVHQFVGDGAIAYFGAPATLEDHARRACVAALELADGYKALGTELQDEEAIALHIRSGLNSGDVVVGAVGADDNQEYVAIGHTVGLAQRMQTLADPDTACVSEHTAALVRGAIELRPRGSFAIKGAREPIAVFELIGVEGGEDGRGMGRELPLVGRVIELAVLDAALRRAAGGDGQVVTLVGDAGVGKRRVIREFAERAAGLGLESVRVRALAHERHVPAATFQLLVHRLLAVDPALADDERRTAISAAATALDPRMGDELPLLLDLLGLGDGRGEADVLLPDGRRRRVVRLLGRLLRARTREEPLLLVVESLQWLDDASAERLTDLMSAVEGAAAMLVVTTRPERALLPSQDAHVHVQRLGPLNAAEQRSMLEDVLGDHRSLGDLGERLAVRAAGNPLFLMEAVRALVDSGTLEGKLGAYRLVATVNEAAIPPTVEALVAARIDRLPEREKSVLQAAAVVGQEFDDAVLERVIGLSTEEIAVSLDALRVADLLRPVDQGHAFRQAVVQEVAYRQQLERRRRALHGSVAAALADVDGELDEEHLALIASHAERAGDHVPAAEWHAQAARVAIEEPVREREHWRQVKRLLDDVTDRDIWLDRLALTARVRLLTLEWRLGADQDETIVLHRQARELATKLGSPTELVAALVGRSLERAAGGDLDDCLALSAEALDVARRGNDRASEVLAGFIATPLALVGRLTEATLQLDRTLELVASGPLSSATAISAAASAHHWRARVMAWRGDLAAARADAEAGIQEGLLAEDFASVGWSHLAGATVYGLSGDHARAWQYALAAGDVADRIGDARFASRLHADQALLLVAAGRADEAVKLAEQSLAELDTAGLRRELWLVEALVALGVSRLLTGDAAAAEANIEEALACSRAAGALTIEIPVLLAAAHVACALPAEERLDEAFLRVDRGLALVRSTGAHVFAAPLHAIHAELHEHAGRFADAGVSRTLAQAAASDYGAIPRPLWRPAPLGIAGPRRPDHGVNAA